MDFGSRLRELLHERNISQKDFAKEMGIAPSTAGNYVNGLREPDYESLKRIARFFHVSTDFLLGIEYEEVEDAELNELVLVFRSLDKKHRRFFLEQGKLLLKNSDS